MNLSTEITKFINSMGDEKAGEYFDRKASTISTWRKSGTYPMFAIQKFLDDSPYVPETVEAPTAEMAEEFAGFPEPSTEELLRQTLLDFSTRLGNIENYLNQIAQVNPQQVPQIPQAPTRQWYEADPTTVGFGSSVRPAATVPTRATFSTPVAGVGQAMVPVNKAPNSPSDMWLKPRPLNK